MSKISGAALGPFVSKQLDEVSEEVAEAATPLLERVLSARAVADRERELAFPR